MKWNKFRLKTTTESEDLVSSMLMDLGIQGIEIEDKVQITTSDDEVYVGNIIDIGETYITIEIDYKTGEELDVFFSELKDVRLVK